MNLKLLAKHIAGAFHSAINPVLADDKSNIACFFTADVVGHKRFAMNFGGYPRSEIAEINAQANLEVQMSLFSELQDFSTGNNPNAGLTDAEIMLSHRSKYMQTASEMQSWIESQLAYRDAKMAATKSVEPSNGDGDGKPIVEPSQE